MLDRAYCKINLALDIVSEREDGYHDLRSIMVPCDFYDELEIVKSDRTEYSCDRRYLHFDENNTVVKALELLKKEYDIKDDFRVSLSKHIPMKAGLAGGSADGAAVIRILNNMYSLSLSEEEIRSLCMKIGSDVLFNYYNRPALVEGAGDRLTFINIKDDYNVLIIKPRNGVSTRECYEALDMKDCIHPDIDLIREKLEKGEEVKHLLKNSLEAPAVSLCKEIETTLKDLKEAGADFAMVSGSGSGVFTIDKDKDRIRAIRERLTGKNYFIRSTRIMKQD
ncbi:MAG: 4-(cytidine 5'-diphospho)-2-C-methyl-D-erythritol kinase [Erysipelotrichaceae bacterium]|nr:4-(cytidine 5'-diphospho)-2-C-methyl-D-erythritol kinase [Erysipelotrichaceae bacterium]